ncbi:hypothetical protein [Duganella sp. P38]|uniref:hypothetical protein n=1 Tax=Duganella sp. P38 TaxID=3423949 RepID=UPI003D79DD06
MRWPRSCAVARDVRQRRRIAEQHARPARADLRQVAVQPFGRHGKGRQQFCAHQLVTDGAHAVLRAQLDRRTPHHDFRIADVHAPPARGAPLGGNVVAHALPAQLENQRLAAGAARVEARQADGVVCLHALTLLADDALVQQRQARQDVKRGGVTQRVEVQAGEQLAVVRHARLRAQQQPAQARQLQRAQPRGAPELALLHLAPRRHGRVVLQAFL